ncbi:MAG: acyloxyacyl hydrolase [Acidobacteriota bacterium]
MKLPFSVPTLAFCLILMASTATPVLAQAKQSDPPLRSGKSLWGIFSSFGFSQEINNSDGDTNIFTSGFRWSHLFGVHGPGKLRGHPAFAVEAMPVMGFFASGRNAYGSGFNLLFEQRFNGRGRVLPIWRLGAGALGTNKEVPEGETQFNFSLVTGFAVDIMVNEGSALEIGYRFHHVSNGNTGNRNPGINAHTIMIGWTFYR